MTKILENAMTKYPQPTYLIILGFIAGSVVQIFPGLPNGLEWIICIGMAAVGFFIIYKLSGKEG